MKTFLQFIKGNNYALYEDLHHELINILNSDVDINKKKNLFSNKATELIDKGIDIGLKNKRAKLGSSRAVYFPNSDKSIEIDGKNSKIKSVVKLAFKSKIDRKNDNILLGQMQNVNEMNPHIINKFSILTKDKKNKYYTNHEHPILAPLLDNHNRGDWVEMAHVDKMTESDFRKLTKNKDFPDGIEHSEWQNLMIDHAYNENPKYNELEKHPFVKSSLELLKISHLEPNDLSIRNMGIFTHPVTKKKYPVISDYGLDEKVANEYLNRMSSR